LPIELAVGADDGVRVDREVDGQLADRGELIARLQVPPGDAELHLLDDLPVEGDAALGIDPKTHVPPGLSPFPKVTG
jgi:hypothetical protein